MEGWTGCTGDGERRQGQIGAVMEQSNSSGGRDGSGEPDQPDETGRRHPTPRAPGEVAVSLVSPPQTERPAAFIMVSTDRVSMHIFFLSCMRDLAYRRAMPILLESLSLADAERKLCEMALQSCGSIVDAAELLGISVRTLRNKLNGPGREDGED